MNKFSKIERNITMQKLSSRGGGTEIDLTAWGYKGQHLVAYQNYLGGGMLGKIANDCTIKEWREDPKLVRLAKKLQQYYANRMGIDLSDYKNLPISAY